MSQYQPMYDTFQNDIRERYVPTSRISVSASVFLPGSDLDLKTGQLKPDHERRRRTQSKRLEAEKLAREERKLKESMQREMKKKGVRVTWLTGLVICAALVIGCLFTINHQLGKLSSIQDQRNEVKETYEACIVACAGLETDIEQAVMDTNIMAAARDMKMVPAESIEAIYLVPVDTRPLVTASQSSHPAGQGTANVQVQPTQAPAIANAGN
ncbi:MAG: hypothetical protein IKK75_09675 [Clostridia bacterium]|nr:hypothetical protein [Clostridia bacterium]